MSVSEFDEDSETENVDFKILHTRLDSHKVSFSSLEFSRAR